MINGNFRFRPLLPFAFFRIYHLRPEFTIDLRGQDILDKLELLDRQLTGTGDIQYSDPWTLGYFPSYSVGD